MEGPVIAAAITAGATVLVPILTLLVKVGGVRRAVDALVKEEEEVKQELVQHKQDNQAHVRREVFDLVVDGIQKEQVKQSKDLKEIKNTVIGIGETCKVLAVKMELLVKNGGGKK